MLNTLGESDRLLNNAKTNYLNYNQPSALQPTTNIIF